MTKEQRAYPTWACQLCGEKHGTDKTKIPKTQLLYGKCDVCEKNNYVARPSFFGHFVRWFKGGAR